jgi:predicted lipoprotein with Yx(FWY)xxD motif
MRRLTTGIAVAGTALAVAACGGGGGRPAAGGASSGSGGATVSVKHVGDLGDALVASDGMTLYTSNVEARGGIRCIGACTSFWKPLQPSASAPTASGDAGRLAVIKRPDGTRQITSNGRPLYTFAEDGPGETKGDGFSDDFGGRHFVWHAVTAGGKPATAGGSSGGGAYSGGGY